MREGAPDTSGPLRLVWLLAGLVCVALGFIGALVPLMPTTIFLILATGCFARSSPRLEAWLLGHPRFGQTLRAWRAEGAISRTAKVMACSGMTIGFGLFCWAAHPHWPLVIGVGAAMAGCAGYVLSRPAPDGAT